jgi:hypothetical protein
MMKPDKDKPLETVLQKLVASGEALDEDPWVQLSRIVYDPSISKETRLLAIEESVKQGDPGDCAMHEYLVDLVCSYEDEIALWNGG